MKKRILFHSYQLGERGTEVALEDYARGNEDVLGNTSICLFPRHRVLSQTMKDRLEARFQLEYYEGIGDWDGIAKKVGAQGLYSIRAGGRDGLGDLPASIPSFVHCVFDTRAPHGTVYGAISAYLNKRFGTDLPVMPHIIERKSTEKADLRASLGLAKGTKVFGCYGGVHNFSVAFAPGAVRAVAARRPDLAFIFMNIEAFCDLPNVLFLPGTTDVDAKQRFINTCDAMVHARADGETFGLSVAEFFISGKPVITYDPRFDLRRKYDKAHLDILGPGALAYRDSRELKAILESFEPRLVPEKTIRATYLEPFSRERVMGIFESLFAGRI